MKELIIYFSQDRTDAYYLQKSGHSVTVLDYHRFKDDESFGQFLKKLKIKQAKAIFEDHETVIKGISTPLLYSEDIESFVSNNINEYFVLDPHDFEVDYRITSMNRKTREMQLMLTAAKKEHIEKIKSFFTLHNIKFSGLTVMPEVLTNLLQREEKKSVAILRVQGRSAWIHIEREKNVFLHTSLEYEELDGVPSENTLENISYYLNFYSKQYFGETIDKVIIQAEVRYEEQLKKSVSMIYEGEVTTLPSPLFTAKEGGVAGSLQPEEAWISGVYPDLKPVFNKTIDYSVKRGKYILENRKQGVIKMVLILVLITMSVQGGFILLERYMKSFYSTELIQIPEDHIAGVNEMLRDVNTYERGLLEKVEILTDIERESIDFMAYLNVLQQGIPKEAKISQISFNSKSIDVNFFFPVESSRTLDAARLILALNDTGLFKPVKLSSLSMDNSQEYLQLNLLLISSDESEPVEGEGITDGN